MNRPKGSRKYFRQQLTPKEKRKILAETRKGTKQIEIARQFGTCVDTIRAVQRAAELRRWRALTPEVERECVALLRLGRGQYRVSKMTRVSEPKIRALMAKYRIHHPLGGLPLPAAKRRRIIEKICERKKFAARIAAEENVSRASVLAPAHAIYGLDRFRSRGLPFSSVRNSEGNIEANYQKFLETLFRRTYSMEAQVMELTAIFTKLVERYAQIWYDGNIPADRNAFIEELVSAYMPENLRPRSAFTPQEWCKERQLVAAHVRTAVESLAGIESRWTN